MGKGYSCGSNQKVRTDTRRPNCPDQVNVHNRIDGNSTFYGNTVFISQVKLLVN